MAERMFEIWCEGYEATGNYSPAQLFGTQEGEDFRDACIRFFANRPDLAKDFDSDRMTHWGCGLFDNEAEARKFVG